jgi:hypothetical protein
MTAARTNAWALPTGIDQCARRVQGTIQLSSAVDCR